MAEKGTASSYLSEFWALKYSAECCEPVSLRLSVFQGDPTWLVLVVLVLGSQNLLSIGPFFPDFT